MKINIPTQTLQKMKRLVNVPEGSPYVFLGYELDWETGEIRDLLRDNAVWTENAIQVLATLLSHYASAKAAPRTGKLIKFKDLPGGSAYERAFLQRVAQPIAQVFGENPAELVETAKLLRGERLDHGDASVEIPALDGVSIVYILWAAGEFSASASVLFDESASSYLPTEDLAVLAELTTFRLEKAKMSLE